MNSMAVALLGVALVTCACAGAQQEHREQAHKATGVDAVGQHYAATLTPDSTQVVSEDKRASAGDRLADARSNSHRTWVTGYYAAYYWNYYPPELIDMTTMTHVLFAHVFPGAGQAGGAAGTLVSGAGTAQVGIANGTGIPYHGAPSVEDYFVRRAHAAGIQALAVVGGSGDGEGFVACTATPALTQTFVNNILNYLVAHDYDGVDIDWEDHLDASTYGKVTALLDELRAESTKRKRFQAPHPAIVITFPGYVLSSNSAEDYPRAARWRVEIAKRVDQYNLMSYSMAYAADGWLTWYFSPLRNNAKRVNHPLDLESTLNAYVAAGVPKEKLGVGIGLYGMNYAAHPVWKPATVYKLNDYVLHGVEAYRASRAGTSAMSGGPSPANGEIVDGTVHWTHLGKMGPDQPIDTTRGPRGGEHEYVYWKIMSWVGAGLGTPTFDAASGASYIVFPNGPLIPGYPPDGDHLGYLVFEDERSIAAKGQYVHEHGYGGAIVWTINYGAVDDNGSNPAMAAVKRAFMSR